MLRALPEQKSLIYFASGLRLNGINNQAQMTATTNALNSGDGLRIVPPGGEHRAEFTVTLTGDPPKS